MASASWGRRSILTKESLMATATDNGTYRTEKRMRFDKEKRMINQTQAKKIRPGCKESTEWKSDTSVQRRNFKNGNDELSFPNDGYSKGRLQTGLLVIV